MRHSKKCRVTVMNTCDRTSEQHARGDKSDTSMYAVHVCIYSPVHVRFTAGNTSIVKLESQLLEDRALKPKRSFGDRLCVCLCILLCRLFRREGASCCTLKICSHFCAHIAKSSHDIPGFPIAELK